MNPVISLLFLVVMSIVVIATVSLLGQTVIDTTANEEAIRQAEDILKFLDNSISDLIEEGPGAKRVLEFYSPGSFESLPQEEVLQFHTEKSVIDHFPRKIIENLIYVSGNDVSCTPSSNLLMENIYLKVNLQRIDKTEPLSTLNTENNIISITEKTTNSVISPSNSSLIINNDPSTAYGTGYSEVLRSGSKLPACQVHFYVNSTVDYDVYYILYAGADFLVIEIRNIS